MARKKRRSQDDGPPGVGDWIVTFSDCMTLLLCFFVLLLTFSSFDEESLKRFGGAFSYDQIRPGVEERFQPKDAMSEPVMNLMDQTRQGSETPGKAHKTPESTDRPESRWTPEDAAYLDRKIIHIPSAKLFEPHTSDLRDEGKSMLDLLRGFLREMPCRIVISESTPRRMIAGRLTGRRGGLNRAWAITHYLTTLREITDAKGHVTGRFAPLPSGRFSVSTALQAPAVSSRADGTVEIVLLSGKAQR